ncbi:Homocysteine S-methyltransferase [Caulifigura coniformis]|uniref:Homocysteine S-methyltransferase n=1 Tax=Caulifigura coniformis TaxID=2527983 RepID=A0A517SBN8_9PLAN|nr:homocysteine S-methyltransferase family protein [Caulifigura coniformis]QDT53506.1 Homocysteine S-methyltransferase [Caulifigura coniformis]
MTASLDDLLNGGRPVLLDGATGTELERRGFALEGAGWSARAIDDAPELLEAIHKDYVKAGAQIVTANTFRLHRRNLGDWGKGDEQRRLVEKAIVLARRAGPALVAGSLAPIGDCYSPEDVPRLEALADEHWQLAHEIARSGADLILIETMVAGCEAEAACQAAGRTGLPFIVSFVTGPGGRLLSGERLGDVLPTVLALRPAAVSVNCVSCRNVPEAVVELACGVGVVPFGVYANTGERSEDGSWRVTTASQPAVYAGLAARWLEAGARLIGGCCGTTPAHVSAMQALISQ